MGVVGLRIWARRLWVVAVALALTGTVSIAPEAAAAKPSPVVGAFGDVLVADAAAFGGPGGVIRVNPANGERSTVSENAAPAGGPSFADPFGVAFAANGDLLVVDQSAFGSGGVIRVNPANGERTTVSENAAPVGGPSFVNPRGIAVARNGDILISDREAFGGSGGVIRVNPATGERTTLSANTAPPGNPVFDDPIGIAIAADGDVYVADQANSVRKIIRVDAVSGARTTVSENPPCSDEEEEEGQCPVASGQPNFGNPFGIGIDADGSLLVADISAFDGNGGIIRVDPATGVRSAVSSNSAPAGAPGFVDPRGVVVGLDGDLLVVDDLAFGGGGGVIRVDPATGARSAVSANGSPAGGPSFEAPFGLAVQPAVPTVSTTATPSMAIGGSAVDVATVIGEPSPAVAPTGTVSFAAYGPDAPTCAGTPIAVSTNALGAAPDLTATSGALAATGPGTFRWIATYNGDSHYTPVSGECGAANETTVVTYAGPGRYTPLTPARILDTRTGTGGISGPIGALAPAEVQVTGMGGVPASGVSAVALNVTVTQPSATGRLIIYPAGTISPEAAHVSFNAGETVPNLVVAKLGAGGKVAMINVTGTAHVIYDVAGWYSDDPAGNDGRYTAVTPVRLLDTRGGVRLAPGTSMDLQVSGAGGVPASGAEAVVLNVAVTGPSRASFLTVHPTGESRPNTANLNYDPNETVSNRVIVKLGTGGKVTLYNHKGDTHVIVDVSGWFTDTSVTGTAGAYTPLPPDRLLDTTDGTGGVTGPLAASSTSQVQITGVGGVPATGVGAVVLNATVVGPAANGWLTLFPTGTAKPATSDVNYTSGEERANLVIVPVGTGGKISLYTSASADVILNVSGWVAV